MKRLMCFFDGTWNKPDARDEATNIVKLHRVAPEVGADGRRQLAHYIIGIATEKGYGRFTFAAGAIGLGVAERVQSGYRFLVENYEPGDEIYLFGFSRGAFQARSLAGLISKVGLARQVDDSLIEEIWDTYQNLDDATPPPSLARLQPSMHTNVRIRCLGVWDTVGNIGVPYLKRGWIKRALAFHAIALPPTVDVGLHALSIDEPRGAFSPSFWTKPRGAPLPPGQHVEQVWFSGCHANVGGGYKDATLSDISLLWMAERVMATTGATFDLTRLRAETRPDPLGEAVDPTTDGVFQLSFMLPYIRLIRQDTRGISPWRRSVLGSWRSSRLSADDDVINESVHDSAFQRLGKKVRLRRGDVVTPTVYKPRALLRAAPRDKK